MPRHCRENAEGDPRAMPGTIRREMPRSRHCFGEVQTLGSSPAPSGAFPEKAQERPAGQCPDQCGSARNFLGQGIFSARCGHLGARKHFQGHSRRNPRSYPPGNTWNNPQRSPKSKALLRRGAAKPPALPGPFPGESWERSLGHCPEQSTENSSEQGMASARWALVRSQ